MYSTRFICSLWRVEVSVCWEKELLVLSYCDTDVFSGHFNRTYVSNHERLGLLNTYLALIIPNTAFALPMTVWLLVGYLDGISMNLEEAAMLDERKSNSSGYKNRHALGSPRNYLAGLFRLLCLGSSCIFANFITQSAK